MPSHGAMKAMAVEKAPPAPQVAAAVEPTEMHIVKKDGAFHGHIGFSDGSEHHAAPAASMSESHAALGSHLEQHPSTMLHNETAAREGEVEEG